MEYWDLYDKDHRKLGQIHRRGDKMPQDGYHLTVHVCVLNQKGEMLIQKRAEDKMIFPGRWDVSAAGSAVVDETSEMAAHRETLEEIGQNVDFSKTRPFLTVHFDEGFSDWYVIETEKEIEEFVFQESEVSEIRWASLSEITEMIHENQFVPYHEGFIDLLYSMYKKRGAHQ